MNDIPPRSPHLTPAALAAKAEREARQAAALRANLRRRKTQERGREAPQVTPDPDRRPPDPQTD